MEKIKAFWKNIPWMGIGLIFAFIGTFITAAGIFCGLWTLVFIAIDAIFPGLFVFSFWGTIIVSIFSAIIYFITNWI